MTDRHPPANPTTRFSDRVVDYIRYRPHYPKALLELLEEAVGLDSKWIVADVGSGTGISAELFLRSGCTVYAVEPNAEMRQAAEERLGGNIRFRSIAGTAEATTLPDVSVDLVVAAQAFHWFDPDRARAEFSRILRPAGWLVLVWNVRRTDSAFLRAYEALLQRYGTDYAAVDHRNVGREALDRFFGLPYESRALGNEQLFDLEGLIGRVRSSSYTPAEGHSDFAPMMEELERLFTRHQNEGRVRFVYDTEAYFGQLR